MKNLFTLLAILIMLGSCDNGSSNSSTISRPTEVGSLFSSKPTNDGDVICTVISDSICIVNMDADNTSTKRLGESHVIIYNGDTGVMEIKGSIINTKIQTLYKVDVRDDNGITSKIPLGFRIIDDRYKNEEKYIGILFMDEEFPDDSDLAGFYPHDSSIARIFISNCIDVIEDNSSYNPDRDHKKFNAEQLVIPPSEYHNFIKMKRFIYRSKLIGYLE